MHSNDCNLDYFNQFKDCDSIILIKDINNDNIDKYMNYLTNINIL